MFQIRLKSLEIIYISHHDSFRSQRSRLFTLIVTMNKLSWFSHLLCAVHMSFYRPFVIYQLLVDNNCTEYNTIHNLFLQKVPLFSIHTSTLIFPQFIYCQRRREVNNFIFLLTLCALNHRTTSPSTVPTGRGGVVLTSGVKGFKNTDTDCSESP